MATYAEGQAGHLALHSTLDTSIAAIIATPPSAPVTTVAGRIGAITLTKADVALGSVDNTSDANKPLSTAATNALVLKAPLVSPAFTGTPTVGGALIPVALGGVAARLWVRAPAQAAPLVGDGLAVGDLVFMPQP